MKALFQKYKHAWVFLYAFIYLPWFCYLEKHVTSNFHVIHTEIDEMIPFLEIFIIPYLLWFAYMAVTVLYFFFTDKTDFYKVMAFLIIGMTLFLIISTVFPNGQVLRPTVFERDNIFVDMVKRLYRTDTPTNIFPSIHVYNSLGVCISILHSEKLKKHKWVTHTSVVLTVLIILSTLFLKQHSVLDAISAGLLAIISYRIVYATEYKKEPSLSRQVI